ILHPNIMTAAETLLLLSYGLDPSSLPFSSRGFNSSLLPLASCGFDPSSQPTKTSVLCEIFPRMIPSIVWPSWPLKEYSLMKFPQIRTTGPEGGI
ncbi:4590_t:CDS:2, partial [Racocetra fulgida]